MLLSRSPMTSMSVNATLNSQSTSQVTFADGTGGVGGAILPIPLTSRTRTWSLPGASPTAPGPSLLPAPPHLSNFLTLQCLRGSALSALLYLISSLGDFICSGGFKHLLLIALTSPFNPGLTGPTASSSPYGCLA